MPWFFFKAGMLFKKESVGKVVKKSFRRLILPFIVFTIIGETIKLAINLYLIDESAFYIIKRNILFAGIAIIKFGSSMGNLALWFLPTLFSVRVIYNLLKRTKIYFLIPLLCSIAPLMFFLDLKSPYYLANISSGLFFYAMGDLCRNFKYKNVIICLFLWTAWIILTIFIPTVVDMRANSLAIGYYYLWYPSSLIGIFALNTLCSIRFFQISFFRYMGQHSMGYYCIHLIILTSLELLLPPTMNDGYSYIIIAVILMTLILPLAITCIKRSRFRFLVD